MVAFLIQYLYRCPRCNEEYSTEESGVRVYHRHPIRTLEDGTVEVEDVPMVKVKEEWV